MVPITSGWPAWPISSTVRPALWWRSTSRCTLETSGQVASANSSRRRRASAGTALGTPCAENTTSPSLGHLVQLLDEHRTQRRAARRPRGGCGRSRGAHRPARRSGAGASSTMSIARSTPAQKPRGPARRIWSGGRGAGKGGGFRLRATGRCLTQRSRRGENVPHGVDRGGPRRVQQRRAEAVVRMMSGSRGHRGRGLVRLRSSYCLTGLTSPSCGVRFPALHRSLDLARGRLPYHARFPCS